MRSRSAAACAAGLVVLLAAACSKGSSASTPTPTGPRPSTTAHVQILSPTNGQVVRGGTVQINVALTGAKIVRATSRNIRPDQGHLHVYLDNQIVGMNFGLTDTVGGVKPGLHILRVEFVASDHLPFNPRVFTSVTFEDKS
ncbi:MAG TPA: hypothetical protein VJO72_12500 [Candidatus Dormibacteraeota bacterium]|nr:hypothetical protein [Candidatus Dormibacteraeota bacterium]